MIGSSLGLGLFFIIFGDGGLNPSAVAGGPSVTKLTQSKCIAVKGSGKPANVAKLYIQVPCKVEFFRCGCKGKKITIIV
jgi:hypothetical protein